MNDVCGITGLFHVLIKTNDLQQTMKFYKDVLGLREAPRPDFGQAGAWLACSSPIRSSDVLPGVLTGQPMGVSRDRRVNLG